ncbi:hypothetical protein, partial [Thermomonas sp.]|uniref:hypothetical protein n=1 Tax=Thermomonas sp. TaxID=1971895 RepID=UPI0024872040
MSISVQSCQIESTNKVSQYVSRRVGVCRADSQLVDSHAYRHKIAHAQAAGERVPVDFHAKLTRGFQPKLTHP